MNTSTIYELTSQAEILKAYPIMHQLRTHLDEKAYLDLVMEAKEKDRYRLFALSDQEKIVAVIGFNGPPKEVSLFKRVKG